MQSALYAVAHPSVCLSDQSVRSVRNGWS